MPLETPVDQETVLSGSRADHTYSSIAFGRGWLATTDTIDHEAIDPWVSTGISSLTVKVHPALGWSRASRGNDCVLILGHPVDLVEESSDGRSIASGVLDLLGEKGFEAAIRKVAYLGGRFVCLLAKNDQMRVVPDCAATSAVFWTRSPRLTLASHSALLAEVTGAQPSEAVREMMAEAKPFAGKTTIYLPGFHTRHVGVYPLVANHLLEIARGEVRHTRFYPFSDTTFEKRTDEAYERFVWAFTRHTRLLCTAGDEVMISLTAGSDSGATFRAALPHLGPDSFTWTYLPGDQPKTEVKNDADVAQALSKANGVQHRLALLADTDTDQRFAKAYNRTFREGGQHRRMALAAFMHLPHDRVHLQSMVAEAGTGFFKNRPAPGSPELEKAPTAERLAWLHSRNDWGRSPRVIAAMEAYLPHTDLSPSRLGEFDYHDAFYWELRLSRWAAIRFQELDLVHRVALTFNSRHVLEGLVGPPLTERSGKQALIRFVAGGS
jgi:asparagine synthase (glutamine-hydrolysing)